MYAVVGCTDCSALWIVEGRPDTTGCPRCGKRRQFSKLRKFVETEEKAAAAEARASMLANRGGEGEAFAGTDSFAEMDSYVGDAGMDDEEYLEAAGIDADAAGEAGERAESGSGGSTSRKETVENALRELDDPTEERIVSYAAERGVPADYTETALERLRRAGEVAVSEGVYRRL
jgi:predicted  nucleic acid-binding Zn-ribbon protein